MIDWCHNYINFTTKHISIIIIINKNREYALIVILFYFLKINWIKNNLFRAYFLLFINRGVYPVQMSKRPDSTALLVKLIICNKSIYLLNKIVKLVTIILK